MRFKAIIPFIDDMGSHSPINCSGATIAEAHEDLKWELNSNREHDGLEPWSFDEYWDTVGHKIELQLLSED